MLLFIKKLVNALLIFPINLAVFEVSIVFFNILLHLELNEVSLYGCKISGKQFYSDSLSALFNVISFKRNQAFQCRYNISFALHYNIICFLSHVNK